MVKAGLRRISGRIKPVENPARSRFRCETKRTVFGGVFQGVVWQSEAQRYPLTVAQGNALGPEVFGKGSSLKDCLTGEAALQAANPKTTSSWGDAPCYRECNYVYQHRAMWPTIRKLHADGALNEVQQVLFAKAKPEEELYDLENDPWEINNLAESPDHQEIKARLGTLLDGWIADTRDRGLDNLEYDRKNIIQPRKKKRN